MGCTTTITRACSPGQCAVKIRVRNAGGEREDRTRVFVGPDAEEVAQRWLARQAEKAQAAGCSVTIRAAVTRVVTLPVEPPMPVEPASES